MRVIHHSYRLAEPLQTNNYYPYGLGLGDAFYHQRLRRDVDDSLHRFAISVNISYHR